MGRAPFLLASLLSLAFSGCASSRWAMAEPAYRVRYSHPYDNKWEKIPRMAKQMADARHIEDRVGMYMSAGAAGDPLTAGAEIGVLTFPEAWCEVDAGITGMLGTGAFNAFGGANVGGRVQTPTRLAPFVGLGGFAGISPSHYDFGPVTVHTEEETFLAIYPEVGVHFWTTPRFRVSGLTRYYITTQGREEDFWYFGLMVSILGDPPYYGPTRDTRLHRLPPVE